jgi:sporulation protein YlmC with PRC-barrel domain
VSDKLHLVHDVLDKMVLDRNKHRLGRVDTLVLQIRDDAPPRVVYMEMGGAAMCSRLGGLGRRVAAWIGGRGRAVPRQPYRVAWDLVRQIGPAHVVIDADVETSRTTAWERWLAEKIVARLGG